jgi:hypothetical protein
MHFGRYLLVTGELSCTSLLDIICTHERNGAYGKTGVIQKRHLGGGFSMYNNCVEPSCYIYFMLNRFKLIQYCSKCTLFSYFVLRSPCLSARESSSSPNLGRHGSSSGNGSLDGDLPTAVDNAISPVILFATAFRDNANEHRKLSPLNNSTQLKTTNIVPPWS